VVELGTFLNIDLQQKASIAFFTNNSPGLNNEMQREM